MGVPNRLAMEYNTHAVYTRSGVINDSEPIIIYKGPFHGHASRLSAPMSVVLYMQLVIFIQLLLQKCHIW